MTDTTLGAVDRTGTPIGLKAQVNVDESLTLYHAEDAAQRATLLAQLAALLAAIGQPGWSLPNTATNATAAVTQTAVTGKAHRVRGVVATFNNPPNGARPLVQISVGGTPIYTAYVRDGEHLMLFGDAGLAIPANTAVSASLGASGDATITGAITLFGDTE